MRIEKDSFGTMQIEDHIYYGINTIRACENFGQIDEHVDPVLVRAYVFVKKACAMCNLELGYLPKNIGEVIIASCDELLQKTEFNEFIVINPLSGGAGTSLNMNINEVIANLALEKAGYNKGEYQHIHPLRDVNMHQSTNDTFPTAVKMAILFYLEKLENSLITLQKELQNKEKEFSGVIKLARTEMQDALPMTLGMQFSAYAEAIGRDRWRIFKARERIKIVNIGGTAIGTGFNAPQQYIFRVIEVLKNLTQLNISRGENLIDSTQNMDAIVEVSGLIKTMAVNLLKISQDLRIQSSGPEGGIAEIVLPEMQEGSTIMPGKVNPVILEFVEQNALLTINNDNTISQASGLGNFELNQFLPLISHLILKNLRVMIVSIEKLTEKVIRELKINAKKIESNYSNSMALVTYLSQYIGHDRAGEVYQLYKKTSKPIKQIIIEQKILTEAELNEYLSPEKIKMMGLKK